MTEWAWKDTQKSMTRKVTRKEDSERKPKDFRIFQTIGCD